MPERASDLYILALLQAIAAAVLLYWDVPLFFDPPFLGNLIEFGSTSVAVGSYGLCSSSDMECLDH